MIVDGRADALDVVSLVLIALGALLSLSAGVGLLRFPDAVARMHAQTKPQIFGLMLVLVAIALQQTNVATVLFLVPIMVFQMLTTPVAATVLARAAYRGKHGADVPLFVDELSADVEHADAAHEERPDGSTSHDEDAPEGRR